MSKISESNSSGLGIFSIVGIVFIILKLAGLISWPWLWVLSPFWIWIILAFIVTMIIAVIAFLAERDRSAD